MNKTKKLTTGAMLLSILGASMLIDRQFTYLFSELILVLAPVIVIMYGTMYEIKDGIVFSVSLLFLTFIFGDLTYYVYMPLSIIVGIGYALAIKKGFDKKRLLLLSMALFIIGELLVMVVIMPLLGLGSMSEYLGSFDEVFAQVSQYMGMEITPESVGFGGETLMGIAIFSISLTRVLEGMLIHILALIMLKRFKIADIANGSVISMELNPVVSYVLFFFFAANMILGPRIENEMLKTVMMICYLTSMLILAYYGYLFSIVYLKRRYPANRMIPFLFIMAIFFLFPMSLMTLVVIGFLYGSGPLKKLLIIDRNNQK